MLVLDVLAGWAPVVGAAVSCPVVGPVVGSVVGSVVGAVVGAVIAALVRALLAGVALVQVPLIWPVVIDFEFVRAALVGGGGLVRAVLVGGSALVRAVLVSVVGHRSAVVAALGGASGALGRGELCDFGCLAERGDCLVYLRNLRWTDGTGDGGGTRTGRVDDAAVACGTVKVAAVLRRMRAGGGVGSRRRSGSRRTRGS